MNDTNNIVSNEQGKQGGINKEKYLIAMRSGCKAVYLVKYQAKKNRFADTCWKCYVWSV